jgi:hypothetical protein
MGDMELTVEEIKQMNIYRRVHAIMGEVGNLPKTKEIKNKAGIVMYKVVQAEKLDAVLRPLLTKYRVLIVPSTIALENEKSFKKNGNYENPEYHATVTLRIKWVNIDDPKDSFFGDWPGDGIDSGDKAIGKAATYAFRIGRTKTLHISTGDPEPEEGDQDDDSPPAKPTPQDNKSTKNNQGQAAGQKVKFITKAQGDRFIKFAKSLGLEGKAVQQYLAKGKIKKVEEIPADRFNSLFDGLKQLAGGK